MKSRNQRLARLARHPRSPPLRPSARHNAQNPQRRPDPHQPLARLARPGPPRPNRSHLRNLRPPRSPFRRRLNPFLRQKRQRQQSLGRRHPPSPHHRSRRKCRLRAPLRRAPFRPTCRHRGVWSLQVAKNPRGRFFRHFSDRRPEPTNRRRHRDQFPPTRPAQNCRHPRLDCRRLRRLPTAARFRPRHWRLARVRASRFRRRPVRHAPLRAAAAPTVRVPLAGSAVQRAVANVPMAGSLVAGALTQEPRQRPADAQRVRLVHAQEVRVARHAAPVGALAVAVVASARNCSPSSSPPTRRSTHPFPKARSSSSGVRRPRRSPPV